jgi:hypothetical protein
MTKVPSKYPNKPPIKIPNVMLDYIKHMAGIKCSDHNTDSYQFMRTVKKWYKKMLF